MYCSFCGNAVPDGAKFCSQCGKELPSETPTGNAPTPKQPDHQHTKPLRWILVILFVAALAVGLLWVLLRDDPESGENSSGTSSNPTSATEPSASGTETAVGCASEEELIQCYIDWLNKRISDEEFYAHHDYKGCIAMFLYEDGAVENMALGYQIATAYLNHEITDENTLQTINRNLTEARDTHVISAEEWAQWMAPYLSDYHKLADQAAPYEDVIDRENIYQHKSGHSSYHIPLHDVYYPGTDLPVRSLNMYYYCQDGIWRWILVNEAI